MNDATNTADTILRQLGGSGRLSIMIGAKNFVGEDRALSFRFAARAKYGANWIEVTLAGDDTYTIRFAKVTRPRFGGETVAERGTFRGVYVAQLRATIERETELRRSL